MKLSNAGITLIELMISMVILSAVLGMTSSFVKKGMEHPFTMFGVEEWIFLVEESGGLILNLSADSEFESIRVDDYPLRKINKPRDFGSWNLKWEETNLPNVKVVVFIAASTSNQIHKWKIYKTYDR